jgi:LysM repeat protein
MKFKILLFITPLLTLSAAAFANPLIDSIGIENLDGKKVILHKLDPKDNYFSIGRRYNVRPNLIIQFNNNAVLKIGNVVKVPTDRSFLETTKTAPAPVQQPVVTQPAIQKPVTVTPPPATTAAIGAEITQYKVSAGETLFSIAKRFNSTVEDVTKLNGLTSTTLSAGQVLKIKSGSADAPAIVRPVAKRDSVAYSSPQDSINAVRFGANRFGLFEKSEKGIATWIDDAGLDPNKKLALHRTAPIGTVIKITNPMTGRTTFAKVVGRFTDNESTKDAIIVVTKNVAESIGGLDKRIHVNISYGTPNE